MKKLIMLSAIGILTLSSFNSKDSNDKIKIVKADAVWYYRCVDGDSGSFSCSFCTQADAQEIANYRCSHN